LTLKIFKNNYKKIWIIKRLSLSLFHTKQLEIMADIYSAPKEIKLPKLDFTDMQVYNKDCERYVSDLVKHIKDMGYKGKNVGEIVRFAVADGYAEYMVLSMKPMKLIHIPLGDAYEFQYAHLMTASEINKKLEGQKIMAKLFK
jgi:hypothetical protein